MTSHSHSHSHDHAHSHDHDHEHHHESASPPSAPAVRAVHDHHSHGHSHEPFDGPGDFAARPEALRRDYRRRPFTVGIGGPVGSGKTALLLQLCRALRNDHHIAVVTNDIFTREDAEFLTRNEALEPSRIVGVETGGCPHAAIREDISMNLDALEQLQERFGNLELLFVESGGDNLAADFSRELADFTIYVIDVSAGDKIPRKGGPGVTQSDLLMINKTDLAPLVGADLSVMERDSARMRSSGPTLFAQAAHGIGIPEVAQMVLQARDKAVAIGA